MTTLRAGTRGSDLALWQTRWVVDRLRAAHPSVTIDEVVIKTHGDVATEQKFDADWPVGGFVGAIEQALARGHIDFAVHSYKDLQTAVTPGLVIAAVPPREVVHDVLVTREALDLDHLRPGFRLGTSSPRRAAQFRRLGDLVIVPIRGNVATRIATIKRDNLDGVVLAAAGLKRLGINPPHRIDLPTDRFVPSPAQGALAVQTRENDIAATLVKTLDDEHSRRGVEAERSFLRAIGAGCHVPVGALATVDAAALSLHGQLFSEDGSRMAEAVETGDDPQQVGPMLADRLMRELGACREG
ncbi:MAG: hydroxymethylbilane synthase [Phycisphaerae bacterium]